MADATEARTARCAHRDVVRSAEEFEKMNNDHHNDHHLRVGDVTDSEESDCEWIRDTLPITSASGKHTARKAVRQRDGVVFVDDLVYRVQHGMPKRNRAGHKPYRQTDTEYRARLREWATTQTPMCIGNVTGREGQVKYPAREPVQ